MEIKEDHIPFEKALEAVKGTVTRLALLHLSFSKILVEELGKEQGTDIIIKSIMEYGHKVNDATNRGFPDLPDFGVYAEDPSIDEKGRIIVRGCNLASVFQEYNELELGCLYCYIDPARSMDADPNVKFIHATCEACGDDKCTFERVSTTEKERKHFRSRDKEWKQVDKRLISPQ